jgi:hypothetical protein
VCNFFPPISPTLAQVAITPEQDGEKKAIHQQRGVSHCGQARQKKNYENSNISPCKNVIFKKSSKRNQNPSRYYNSIN